MEINYLNKKNMQKLLNKLHFIRRIRHLESEVQKLNQLLDTVVKAHNTIADRTVKIIDQLDLVEVEDPNRGSYLRKKRSTKKTK